MLDLVLTWASLDGALGMMLGGVAGLPLYEAAELIGKMPASARFAEIIRFLKAAPDSDDVVKALKKHKKTYERFSRPRNRVAHSHCAGLRENDRDFIVFAIFERENETQLAIEAIPIDEIQRANRWGRAMRELALRISDVLEEARERKEKAT